MRRAARVDDNQAELVAQLRAYGASVAVTSALGQGFPDIVVGFQGRNWLLEIKDPSKVPSKRRLTPDELAWHNDWRGSVHVVETFEDCTALIGPSQENR